MTVGKVHYDVHESTSQDFAKHVEKAGVAETRVKEVSGEERGSHSRNFVQRKSLFEVGVIVNLVSCESLKI